MSASLEVFAVFFPAGHHLTRDEEQQQGKGVRSIHTLHDATGLIHLRHSPRAIVRISANIELIPVLAKIKEGMLTI